MNEKRQADLLEQFMLMLRKDINAEPPQGLDPKMIEFARKLAKQSYLRPENQSSIDRTTQARIWHRALSATQANQPEIDPDEENEMLLTQDKRKTTQFPLTAIAAVLALVLFGVVIAVATNLNPNDNTASIIPIQNQDGSPTPVPSATHTPTITLTPNYLCRVIAIEGEGGARIRSQPNDSASIITVLRPDTVAEVINQFPAENNTSWYEIRVTIDGIQLTNAYVNASAVEFFENDNCDAQPPNSTNLSTFTPVPTNVNTTTVVEPSPIMPLSLDDLVPVGTTLQELEFGTRITADMVAIVYWHPADLPANTVLGGDVLNTLVGQYATRYIGAYTALLTTDISVDRPPVPTPLPASEVTPLGGLNMVEVVVATQDIPQGAQITADMVELATISVYAVPTEAFLGQDGLDTIIGQYTTINTTQGRVLVGRYISQEQTFISSQTPVPTVTNTPTLTPTITASATFTPTLTFTPTFTVTPAPTIVTTATFTPTPVSPVEIRTIFGAGILEAEAVQFMNNGNTINIGGWTLSDSDGNEYVFPDGRRLFSNTTAILYTRAGQGTPVVIYWGLDEAIFEQGEIVQLRDGAGALIDTYQIP